MLAFLALLVITYLAGSLSSAVLVCRLLHLPDPRNEGSGNPGATNVLRIGGKKAALLVLLGDVLKGALPLYLAASLHIGTAGLAWLAIAAVAGHIWPLFFQFRGGKGVATAFGAAVAIHPSLGLLLALTWLAMAAVFRYSSLAALTATLLAPLYGLVLLGWKVVLPLLIISGILLWRHRQNIARLRQRKEPKIKLKFGKRNS